MSLKRKLALIGLLLIAILFWPWVDNPMNYVKWKDRVRTSLPVAIAFGFPCETREGGVIFVDRSPACRTFDQPREFQGLWLYQFEGSTFIEGATSLPKERPPYDGVAWLNYDPVDFDPQLDPYGYDEAKGCYEISAYLVKFVGRERQGSGGHLGLWGSEIWPIGTIDAKRIPGPDCEIYHGL